VSGRTLWLLTAIVLAVFILAMVPLGRPLVDGLRREGVLGLLIGGAFLGGAALVALLGLSARFHRLATPGEAAVSTLRPSPALLSSTGLLYLFGYFLYDLPEERFHFLEYGLLVLALHRGLPGVDRPWRDGGVLGLAVVLGLFDEGLQCFVPDRVFDPADLLLNLLAALLGAALVRGLSCDKGWRRSVALTTLAAAAAMVGLLAVARMPVQEPSTVVPPQRPNLLLLTVDALRPTRLGSYGYSRPTSPALDSFAARTAVFTRAYAHSAWTAPGLVSLLTGLRPGAHGVTDRETDLPDGVRALPKVLSEAGYALPDLNYLTSVPGYRRLGYPEGGDYAGRLEADRTSNLVVEWLEHEVAEPFFLWYHYRHVHLPYDPGEKYDRFGSRRPLRVEAVQREVLLPVGVFAFSPEEQTRISDLYDGEVLAADDFFAEVLACLRRKGLEERTVVVVTADHGEELFEHGHLGHASTALAAKLNEEVVRIPLLLGVPWFGEARRIDETVVQADLVPTVLELLGLRARTPRVQGRSLVGALEGRNAGPSPPVLAVSSWAGYQQRRGDGDQVTMLLHGRRKLLELRRGSVRTYEYYDLAADPAERDELVPTLGVPGDLLKLLEGEREADRRLSAELAATSASKAGAGGEGLFPALQNDLASLEAAFFEGTLELRWNLPPGLPCRLEYEVGSGYRHLVGGFAVDCGGQRFGPFSEGLRRELLQFNPWRFRLVVESTGAASPWYQVHVPPEPAPAEVLP